MLAMLMPVCGPASVQEIDGSLASLQKLVGGYIQAIKLTPCVVGYINEDGKATGLFFNKTATWACHQLAVGLAEDDYIVGPMVIVGVDENGDEASVPAEFVSLLAEAAKYCKGGVK